MRPIPGTVTDPALGHLLTQGRNEPCTLWYAGVFRVVTPLELKNGRWDKLLVVEEHVRGESAHAEPQVKSYHLELIERPNAAAQAAIAALTTL